MLRIRLICNGHADRGRAARKLAALRDSATNDRQWEWVDTCRPGHAACLAEEAGRKGFDRVIAVGGDGTAHEVINGLMQLDEAERPVMGLVPLGSCNDLAFASGIKSDPQKALAAAVEGAPVAMDVGSVRDASGRLTYWHNTVGILFDASVVIHTQRMKRLSGFAMYFAATVRSIIANFYATHLKVKFDDVEEEFDSMFFALVNGPREGGGFVIVPDADNGDGQLDYLRISPVSRPMMLWILLKVLRGKHLQLPLATHGRFRHLTLEADRALPIHVDGEVWADWERDIRELTVEIHAGQIQFAR